MNKSDKKALELVLLSSAIGFLVSLSANYLWWQIEPKVKEEAINAHIIGSTIVIIFVLLIFFIFKVLKKD